MPFLACNNAETKTISQENKSESQMKNDIGFYELTTTDIHGEPFAFSSLKGKAVILVNTASECGFTPQYAELQRLYESFYDKNFEIIGFPANNFGGQEPGENSEIAEFCKANFGVSFKMMTKSAVVGDGRNDVYTWLENEAVSKGIPHEVEWNFHKVLMSANGEMVASYPSKVSPQDEQIIDYLRKNNGEL